MLSYAPKTHNSPIVMCVACLRAQGIEKAVRLLSGVTGNRLSETQQGRELLELVEEAERALDVEGRTTFRH